MQDTPPHKQDRSLLAPVEAARARTIEVLDSLTAPDLRRVHEATGWTVGQLIGHIAASELGSAFFVRRAREGELIEMDQASRDQFNDLETEKAIEFGLDRLRTELADAHDTLHDAFAGITETDLGKPIVWPEWPARTIGESVPYIAGHESEHLAQVSAAFT